VWCIDPLDGTSNFLKGAHNWCVSIGLLCNGLPVLGVVYDPVRQEMFEGAEGLGVRENGQPMRVSSVGAPDRSAIGIGYVQRVPVEVFCTDTAALLHAGFAFRQVGAGALMLAYLSAGRIDAYFERHMWPWDAVAGLALLREAGGQFAPYQTDQVAMGDLVMASNGHLQAELARILPSQVADGRT
jgi:myo-inositol-1(or 4)-monophosphatase